MVKLGDIMKEDNEKASVPQTGAAPATNVAEKIESEDKGTTEKAKVKKALLVASGKFTPIFDFLLKHKDKISNASIIDSIQFENIPSDKYMFLLSNEEKNGDLLQIHTPTQLQLLHTEEPTDITAYPSGIIITSNSHRSYILKTNCVQYTLDENGFPTSKTTVHKQPMAGGDPSTKETKINKKFTDAEKLKFELNKDVKTLYESIKDFQNLNEIKKEVLTFLKTKKDLSYLIKMEDIMLETT